MRKFHLQSLIMRLLLEIKYFGILPDLFREGQGVVAEGFFDLEDRVFNATNVLAKHDENYMPPEIEKP